jgi:hypothetical protein
MVGGKTVKWEQYNEVLKSIGVLVRVSHSTTQHRSSITQHRACTI